MVDKKKAVGSTAAKGSSKAVVGKEKEVPKKLNEKKPAGTDK